MAKLWFHEQENGYVTPTLDVITLFQEDVITTSFNIQVGDEDFDNNGSAVPFD